MNIAMLLEMAAEGGGERIALGDLSYPALLDCARRAAATSLHGFSIPRLLPHMAMR